MIDIKAIKNGTPLDDIKAEIEQYRENEEPHLCDYRFYRNEGLDMALAVIDRHIGSNDAEWHESEPLDELGTLQIQANCCTDSIRIHPIDSGTWSLYPTEYDGRNGHIHNFASLIHFDGRQFWDVYYYEFADCRGWVVQRNGLYLRMPEKDFERFFGKYEVSEAERRTNENNTSTR